MAVPKKISVCATVAVPLRCTSIYGNDWPLEVSVPTPTTLLIRPLRSTPQLVGNVLLATDAPELFETGRILALGWTAFVSQNHQSKELFC